MSKQKTTTAAAKPKGQKTAPKTAKSKAQQKDDLDAIIRAIITQLEDSMHFFITEENIETNLTGRDRQRLISARSRNYGFIDKAFDIARDNPDFMPPNFDMDLLFYNLREMEDLRQLMLVLQQFLQLVTNRFMQQADFCFRDALRIYASLQEQTRARVPGAAPLFEALQDFFRRRRRETDEPTEKQLEKDIKRLLHGTADGEVIIENVSPKVSGGVHRVVDNVHKGKTVYKETEEAVIDESSTTRKK
jgi:hypothetical protein